MHNMAKAEFSMGFLLMLNTVSHLLKTFVAVGEGVGEIIITHGVHTHRKN